MKKLSLPLLFVTLYGSGFVAVKLGLPYAGPFTFLAWRFGIAALLLLAFVLIMRAPWPTTWKMAGHITVAGLLMIGLYSAATFYVISHGFPPGTCALIVALQPIIIAIASGFFFKQTISFKQWIGLISGLLGVGLVVAHNITFKNISVAYGVWAVIAVLALCAGNIYQKIFCSHMDIRTGGAIQYIASFIFVMLCIPLFHESTVIQWTTDFIIALSWMTIVVSMGALSVLYVLIRLGEINEVASIFYLVPVSSVILGYLVFRTEIDLITAAGIVLAAIGVILARNKIK